ncbi:MAG: hypothetical protein HY699_12550 [Deltaproteobacteria bacterium]|nr:hypothetical protein [Deltaproteobacteria bacterium]
MRSLLFLQRIIRRLLAVAAVSLALAIAAVATMAYLTVSGHSLQALRAATAQLGKLAAGQRTEALVLTAAVYPEQRRLEGHAHLTMRSLQDQRRRFYFLLNSGLTIRRAAVAGSPTPAAVHQLWMITVVDLGRPLAANETVELEFDYDGQPAAGLGIDAGLLDADHVLLNVDDFWYPSDVQSFFQAEVMVTLPAQLTVVHNGHELSRSQRGDRQALHWRSQRPIGGMALVAGRYRRFAAVSEKVALQLYLADDVKLDTEHVLRDMAEANRTLAARFGSAGFPQLTLFVNRRIRRGFNDGSGLMGLSLRYFRRGEYGFATVAHEIAHNWWGGTVAEQWLKPGTGGEWIVEGLAEFSSLLATEARWGDDGLTARLEEEFFDPARQAAVADMSVLDNALAEATARDTIYRKGAYVAMMLRAALGDAPLQRALQQFIERFRYTQVTERDLEAVVRESSGQDVGQFFADWVRSDKLADLALEPAGTAQVDVLNRGAAAVPGPIALWVFGGAAPERRTVTTGETVALPSANAVAILDPLLVWADMLRFNNRTPRQPAPRFVAVNVRGERLVTSGEQHPAAPASLSRYAADGALAHTWEFERGVIEPPSWSRDGSRIIASTSEARGNWPAIVSLNAVDGSRAVAGYGASPAPGGNGQVFAARGDQLVRFDPNGSRRIARHRGHTVETPVPSPSGQWVAYAVTRANQFQLRLCTGEGAGNRTLLSWDRDRILLRWAPDESRLYLVIGGDWDWQLWEVPLEPHAPVRQLVREAASIRDLALSPDGTELAIAAAPALVGARPRHQLYVLDLKAGAAKARDIAGSDIWHLAWETPAAVLAVTAADNSPVVPGARSLRRVHLENGTVDDLSGH